MYSHMHTGTVYHRYQLTIFVYNFCSNNAQINIRVPEPHQNYAGTQYVS
jgi:hypothetical protein